ncbi:MAG: hypothetical protein AAF959_15435 [Cyanobacteria bacterium P01_D01_bin.56]
MSVKKHKIARCGACRFYTPVGRRGGECSQLSVPVQSAWKGCCLSQSPFQSVAEMSSPERQLAQLTVETQVAFGPLPVTVSRPFKVLEAVSKPELVVKVSS